MGGTRFRVLYNLVSWIEMALFGIHINWYVPFNIILNVGIAYTLYRMSRRFSHSIYVGVLCAVIFLSSRMSYYQICLLYTSFQKQFPQGKLVRAVRGSVFDVAVDLRADSKTYGKWFGVELTAENKKQFYIPEGFAHGFLVLSDEAEFAYKCTDFYHPGDEGGLAWNDPEIGIEWPLQDGVELIISDKDKKWSGLKDTFRF